MRPEIHAMVKTMMPSYWSIYKSSSKGSFFAFKRVAITNSHIGEDGERVFQVGVISAAVLHFIQVFVSAAKFVMYYVLSLVSLGLLIISPVINLIMLPFYRRKSFLEVVAYAEMKQDEIDSLKARIDDQLLGKDV